MKCTINKIEKTPILTALENEVVSDTSNSRRSFWEKKSAIRSKPRYVLGDLKKGQYYFPKPRQLLCFEESVIKKGEETIEFILTQTLYKHYNDIIQTEPTLIYDEALRIFMDSDFDSETRLEALTVAIDEAYHGYQAADLMQQIIIKTKIEPLEFPERNHLRWAIAKTKDLIPEKYHEVFNLIAVAIAENSSNREAGSLLIESNLEESSKQFTYDHMVDEGRHARIFLHILKSKWARTSKESQNAIAEVLPTFVSWVLNPESHKDFDRTILKHLNFSEEEIKKILSRVYNQSGGDSYHMKLESSFNNLSKFLEEAGLFENRFLKHNFEALYRLKWN